MGGAGSQQVARYVWRSARRNSEMRLSFQLAIKSIVNAPRSFSSLINAPSLSCSCKTACLNCLYHGASVPQEKFPVIGVTPAVIGCIQATEVIKYIVGLGDLLAGRLLNYDGLAMKFTEFKINRDSECAHCKDAAADDAADSDRT